jgi:hypothetical protein
MGIFEWGAVAALVALGTVVWRLAWKLASQDERIKAAETLAAGASGRSVEVGKDLASFKEHVAANHPSNDALREITDAISHLGNRIDNLILHLMPKP